MFSKESLSWATARSAWRSASISFFILRTSTIISVDLALKLSARSVAVLTFINAIIDWMEISNSFRCCLFSASFSRAVQTSGGYFARSSASRIASFCSSVSSGSGVFSFSCSSLSLLLLLSCPSPLVGVAAVLLFSASLGVVVVDFLGVELSLLLFVFVFVGEALVPLFAPGFADEGDDDEVPRFADVGEGDERD